MRIYGLHSGRNNPAAYLVRSYMWAKREVDRENSSAAKRKISPYEAEKVNYKYNSRKDVNLDLLEESGLTKAIEEACSDNTLNTALYNRAVSDENVKNFKTGLLSFILLIAGLISQSSIILVVSIVIILILISIRIFKHKPIEKEEERYISIEFEDNETYSPQYEEFLESLINCKWVRELQCSITGINSKIHSGATSISDLDLVRIYRSKEPFPELRFNKSIYCIEGKGQILYFLPEAILIKHGNNIRYIKNRQMAIRQSRVRLISDEYIAGGVIVDKTWKYVNKNGSPDKRYSNNPQVNIYQLYEINFIGDGINISLYVSDETVFNKAREVKL